MRSSRPGRSPRLRGCIGSFEAQPLHEGLAEYALISAFRDHRFNKITESELSSLECGYAPSNPLSAVVVKRNVNRISLLTDFEDASSYLDWTVGVHGIYITFPHPSLLPAPNSGTPSPLSSALSLATTSVSRSKQSFTATYLPEVIPDQGWDKIEAVDSAIHKAGWTGLVTEDIRRSIKLRRYQSRKCTAGYEEFVEWRKRNGGEL